MLTACPGIFMSDVPEGASAVAYNTITGGTVTPIAEIQFTLGGSQYTYRAAVCKDEASMADIAGVYDQFDKAKSLSAETSLTNGGSYQLEYNEGNAMGLATWYYPPTVCQYSLFTDKGCNMDQQIEEVVDALLPVPGHSPTPAPVEPPKVVGTAKGVVAHVGDNEIVINMDNGNTITFTMTYLAETAAKAGDQVEIAYSGELTDAPETMNVTVLTPVVQTISGDLVQFDKTSVYVLTASNMVYSFIMNADTKITGKAAQLAVPDTVTLTYTGDLMGDNATATEINITEAVAPAKEENTENKHLTGWVTALRSKTFSIETSKGRTWTFHKDDTTRITGSYAFEEGAKVTVTYDGYASEQPVAKTVKVVAPPDPTPPKPTYHTVSGTVASCYGVFLNLTNGYGFNISGASISGDSDGAPGDQARVTYYEEDGVLYATKVKFTAVDYQAPIVFGPGPVIGGGVTVDDPQIGTGVTVG